MYHVYFRSGLQLVLHFFKKSIQQFQGPVVMLSCTSASLLSPYYIYRYIGPFARGHADTLLFPGIVCLLPKHRVVVIGYRPCWEGSDLGHNELTHATGLHRLSDNSSGEF